MLAAIGLGTATGFLLVGTLALALGAAAIAVVVARRGRTTKCRAPEPETVAVEIGRRDDTIVIPDADFVGGDS